MDKSYWETYYKSIDVGSSPSLFAQFALENHIKEGEHLIELGCGNGRDSVFFARHNVITHALDQCESEINTLRETYTSANSKEAIPNLQFECADFTKLDDSRGVFDHIYSRFTLHSIKTDEEDTVINWAYNNLKLGGKFLIEVRGQKNELYKLGTPVENEPDAYIYNDHFRRFINIETFAKKLEDRGFTILSAEEKTGFAPFEDTDYHFIRIVASK